MKHTRKLVSLTLAGALGLGLAAAPTPAAAQEADEDFVAIIFHFSQRYGVVLRARMTDEFISQLNDWSRANLPVNTSGSSRGTFLSEAYAEDTAHYADWKGIDGDEGAESATGLSAGAAFPPAWKDKLSVSLSGSRSTFSNDYAAAPFGGNTTTVSLGGTWRFSPRLLAGLNLGLERSVVEGRTNDLVSEGYSVTPFVSYVLGNYYDIDWSVGALFGYAEGDFEMVTGAAFALIRGDTETRRFMGSATLNGSTWLDRWNFFGQLGYTRVLSQSDSFRDNTNTLRNSTESPLGRISVTGRASYYFDQWAPYVNATFHYDHLRKRAGNMVAGIPRPTDDRTDVDIGGGATFFLADGFTGGVSFAHELGRIQNSNTVFSGNLRYAF